MLKFYFGNLTYHEERNIQYDFRYIGQILECIKNSAKYTLITSARSFSEKVNRSIIDFSINTNILLQTGKVDENKDIAIGERKERREFDCR